MFKKLILLSVIILCIFITPVFAGNNTLPIENTTETYTLNEENVTCLTGGDSNISFTHNYTGYCIEYGEHSARENDLFYIENLPDNMEMNCLKVMFTFYYPETLKDPIATQHMIWKFTDNKTFSRFNQSWYDDIVATAKNVKVPNHFKTKINDTHYKVYDFVLLKSRWVEFQDYFGFRFYIMGIPTENNTIINNNTVNKTNTSSAERVFNKTFIQYNKQAILKTNKTINNYILTNTKSTGNPYWTLTTAIMLILLTIILRRSDQ